MCSWNRIDPFPRPSGGRSFRMVRMMAPRGMGAILVAELAVWNQAAADSASPPSAETKPSPAPTPRRPRASRRLNWAELPVFFMIKPPACVIYCERREPPVAKKRRAGRLRPDDMVRLRSEVESRSEVEPDAQKLSCTLNLIRRPTSVDVGLSHDPPVAPLYLVKSESTGRELKALNRSMMP